MPTPKRPRRAIPLLAALLAVFVPLVSVVAGAVIWQGYQKSIQSAMDAGQQLFQGLQTEIAIQQQSMFEPLRFLISTYADDPDFGAGAADRYLGPFITVLERYPQVSGFRVGFETGELFEVVSLGSVEPVITAALAAPTGSAFAVHIIAMKDRTTTETWRFLDRARTEISSRAALGMRDDPRAQPWYRTAKDAPTELIETQPYVFSVTAEPGISVAKTFGGVKAGVVSADVSLRQLSLIVAGVASDHDEQLFLFYGDGKLLAHKDFDKVVGVGPVKADQPVVLADVRSLENPVITAMMDRYAIEGGFSASTMMIGQVAYLAAAIRLGQDGDAKVDSPVYLGLALPESIFTGGYNTVALNAVFVSLVILALSLPIIVVVARRFSTPLAKLAAETNRIAQLDLTRIEGATSRIAEIAQLGESIDNMKMALSQITKFVPKSLVQDLVRSGARMEVGGERRAISVLFTDVKDFTTLAEQLPAEALMTQMSEYFDVVVRAVFANGGTVDKYVGDAVFAFWNAPSHQAEHEMLACRAALSARAASNALNDTWRAMGKPEWYTRLGVHAGDAVVGNVGSSDRLDYTAIGDTVNMGSRLEGLNKVYGTQILASGPIVEKTASRFHFRPIDIVVPKGAILPIEIFELRAERDDENTAHATLCAAWQPVIDHYRRKEWALALGAIQSFAQRYPTDHPAKALLARIDGFTTTPPAPDWDGVTRFDSK